MSLQPLHDPLLVSRVDRLGDLVLSIPTLKFLRDHGFSHIVLRVSPYAKDIGHWAKANGLCDQVVDDSELSEVGARPPRALCLYFDRGLAAALGLLKIKKSWGPRSRLSALWTLSHSIAQHRSHVAMSEMNYNLELARAMLRDLKLEVKDFVGCAALTIPKEWADLKVPQSDVVVNLANRGSAGNWSTSQYVGWVREHLQRCPQSQVTFLLSGDHAEQIERELVESQILSCKNVALQKSFASVRELIVFLSGARLVLSSSTGPLHIAHAAGVEVLGVYPTKRVESFTRWRPDGFWHAAPVSVIEFS